MSLVQKMISAAALDVNLYESVEADQNATTQAMTVVIISSLAAGIGAIRSGLLGVVVAVVGALIGWVIWSFLCYFIGTKILPEETTDADLGQLLRTTGFAQAPGVLRIFGIIPFIGVLISLLSAIWMLVATVIAVRQALDYKSTLRAVGVCLIGFVVYMVFAVVLGLVMAVGAGAVSAVTG